MHRVNVNKIMTFWVMWSIDGSNKLIIGRLNFECFKLYKPFASSSSESSKLDNSF